MDARSIINAVMWLAILGLVILVASRFVTRTASKAAAAL